MLKAFFISDAHLGLESKDREVEKERRLLSFLQHVKTRATHLFILGDLFDAWFEYRTVIPKGYHRLLTMLEDLTTQGIEVHYLAGNHDYWMRDYFREALGIHVYPEPFEKILETSRFYFHHGDGLAGMDLGYRFLKILLRNPLAVWLYSWVHPDIGIGLAKLSSRKSRHYTSQKDYGAEDSMRSFAARRINEGVDFVIMGHRHRAERVTLGKGVYVNLGDWITSFTYAEFSKGMLELKTWER